MDNQLESFEWEAKHGLNYVSDKALKIANYFLDTAHYVLKYDKDNNELDFSCNIANLCSHKYTEDDIINALENNNGILDGANIFRRSNKSFIRKATCPLDHVCPDCNYSKCPKYLTAYMHFLKEKGLLEQKLKEREEFRANNKVNDIFTFDLKWDKTLMNCPEKIYYLANYLVDNDLIYLDRETDKENGVYINSFYTCTDLKISDGDIKKLPQKNPINKSSWKYIPRKIDHPGNLCRSYSCALGYCPLVVAGYIYYLKKTGNENKIQMCRTYYEEHKKEIDKENASINDKKLEQMNKETYQNAEELEKYKGKVENIDLLIDMVTSKFQNNMHCMIKGGLDDGRTYRLIKEIVNVLDDSSKTNCEKPIIKTMQQFASDNTIRTNSEAGRIEYYYIKPRQVFVLEGIGEFIKDYTLYKDADSSSYKELRKKQFEHAIDLLTSMTDEYYIFIVGSENEIERLLDLNQKIKFIYQNNIFGFYDLTKEELYDEYVRNIRIKLLDKLRENEDEYRKEFFEFISLNENFLPLKGIELAKYLAEYSNLKNEICFPENVYKKETIDESFENIVGMKLVKHKIKELEKYMLFQAKSKASDLDISLNNLHMVFTGNPGTGKTTIARVIAKMLYDLGIIKENKLIEVSRKDLVGQYLGQTAPKTAGVIQDALGGVLFIDEAYSLTQGRDSYGLEAIATLIKAMEDYKDKLVVIFAGYKDEMMSFLNSNSGISSRIGYTFDFPDYTTDELIEIFNRKMSKMGFKVEPDINIELKRICSYFSGRRNFGNGRFVDKVVQETIIKHSQRDTKNIEVITLEDIPSIEEINNEDTEDSESAEKLLNGIVGLKEVKEKLKNFEAYVQFVSKAKKSDIKIPKQNLHMVFTGNSGTGKTTVARIVAKMLYDLGIIHENKLVEVEGKDLIAEYVGQTAPKTAEVIEKALGGVLFIDEAYSITQGRNSFGSEAIATLIKAMEDKKDQLVVIFAGYKKEMASFIKSNSGLSSRIGYTFDFADYTSEELEEILYKKIENAGMKIRKPAKEKVSKIMKYFCRVENIGNGRFADKVFQEILMKHAKNNSDDLLVIIDEDIPTIEEMTKLIYEGNYMVNPEEITDKDLKKTATHEVGHAIVRLLLFDKPGIKKITINAEGTGALGYVMYEISERYTQSKEYLLNTIKSSLAGIAAEKVYFGSFENGGTSDLEKATNIAKNMTTTYGMSDLGLARIDNPTGEMAKVVYDEANKILNKCFEETIELIETNKNKMDKVIKFLLKHKEITEEELIENFK